MANVNVSSLLPPSPPRPFPVCLWSISASWAVIPLIIWWWENGGSRGCVNVLQGGWDAIGSTLAIQPVRRWCRARGVFRAESAETFTGTSPRWPSTSKCIATRLHAPSATPLSVVKQTCGDTCAWNTKYTTPGKKFADSAARKANWTHRDPGRTAYSLLSLEIIGCRSPAVIATCYWAPERRRFLLSWYIYVYFVRLLDARESSLCVPIAAVSRHLNTTLESISLPYRIISNNNFKLYII